MKPPYVLELENESLELTPEMDMQEFLVHYMALHDKITLPIHVALYERIGEVARGEVIDLGSGSGKLIEYLEDVDSYLGIERVDLARLYGGFRANKAPFKAEIISGELLNLPPIRPRDTAVSSLVAYITGEVLFDVMVDAVEPGGLVVGASINPGYSISVLEEMVNPAIPGMIARGEFTEQEWQNYLACNYYIESLGMDIHTWTDREVHDILEDRGARVITTSQDVDPAVTWDGNLFYFEAVKEARK